MYTLLYVHWHPCQFQGFCLTKSPFKICHILYNLDILSYDLWKRTESLHQWCRKNLTNQIFSLSTCSTLLIFGAQILKLGRVIDLYVQDQFTFFVCLMVHMTWNWTRTLHWLYLFWWNLFFVGKLEKLHTVFFLICIRICM